MNSPLWPSLWTSRPRTAQEQLTHGAARISKPTGEGNSAPALMMSAEDRYRTLLRASSALSDQPTGCHPSCTD
jgi:hypothetical protein